MVSVQTEHERAARERRQDLIQEVMLRRQLLELDRRRADAERLRVLGLQRRSQLVQLVMHAVHGVRAAWVALRGWLPRRRGGTTWTIVTLDGPREPADTQSPPGCAESLEQIPSIPFEGL